MGIDWHTIFVPTVSLVELFLRASFIYLLILFGLRLFRRDPGSLSTPDLLVLVLVADAAQNAMAAEYHSVTEGAVLVATLFGWNYFLDWLGFRVPWVHRLLKPRPLLLVKHGRIQRRNLKSELLTVRDLMEQLREQGIEDLSEIRKCFLEGDGRLSVIKYQESDAADRHGKDRSLTVP